MGRPLRQGRCSGASGYRGNWEPARGGGAGAPPRGQAAGRPYPSPVLRDGAVRKHPAAGPGEAPPGAAGPGRGAGLVIGHVIPLS